MQKTIILAIFTLGLAAATLVTDLVSPHRGGVDSAVSAPPAAVHLQASKARIFDAI